MAANLINRVIELQQQGYSDDQIASAMSEEGIPPNQIMDAINKSKIKAAVYQPEAAGYPVPDQYPQQMPMQQQAAGAQGNYPEYVQGMSSETVTEIAEQIISEKLADITKSISKVTASKESMEKRLALTEEKIAKAESIIEELRSAIIRKIGEYGQNLEGIKNEMGMMQDSFSKALKPLAETAKKARAEFSEKKEKEAQPEAGEDSEDSFLERRLKKV